MLRDVSNDLFHVLNILESIGKIKSYINSIQSPEEFLEANDQMVYNATLTLLTNVGETLGKLSEETLGKLSSLDLRSIKGMRNRIVHDYTGLDTFIIFDVAKTQVDEIKYLISKILKSDLEDGLMDAEECNLAKESKFYRHIDFDEFTS